MALLQALEDVNTDLPQKERIPVSSDTILFGEGGHMDSLLLTSFILSAESRVNEQFGSDLVFTDGDPLERPEVVLRSVETLAQWVTEELGASG